MHRPHQHTLFICPVIITKMSHKYTTAIKGKVPSSQHQEAEESSLEERETQIYLQILAPGARGAADNVFFQFLI